MNGARDAKHARHMRGGTTLPSVALLRARFTTEPGMPRYLARVAQEHGSMVRFRGPGTDVWFASDPAGIEQVLVSKAGSFEKGRGTKLLGLLLGRGLLTSEPPEHLVHRRLVQPAFRRERIAEYARVMVECTAELVAGWHDGETVDVTRATSQLALAIASQALFGTSFARADAEALSTSLERAMRDFPYLLLPMSEYWTRLPLPIVRRFRRSKAVIDGVVERMIREHRSAAGNRDDVLAALVAARDDDMRGGMSDAQVRDEALTILLAGHETTATALAWTFYLLQRHPAVEARLHAHLDAQLGGRLPTIADVPHLEYVRALFAESMRLYPPAWATARRATADVTIDGTLVRAGALVLVSQYVTHRDPRFWHEPERFDPERFLAGAPSPKFAYFPFGGGPRLCIGESFAWTEGILAIATIASRVRLERDGDGDIPTQPLVTLRPRTPIRARVRVRPSCAERYVET